MLPGLNPNPNPSLTYRRHGADSGDLLDARCSCGSMNVAGRDLAVSRRSQTPSEGGPE